MTREAITLNGKVYPVARKNGDTGPRQIQKSQRPWQYGDPTRPRIAEWNYGRQFYSTEDISNGDGYLGVDWGDGVDTRWQNRPSLGPLINTVTLSTYDQTYTYTNTPFDSTYAADVGLFLDGSPVAGNVTAMVVVEGPSTPYLYILRGQLVSKVRLSDMTVMNDTHVLPEAGTSMLLSYTADNAPELTVTMAGQPYHVLTIVRTAPDPDNWSQGQTIARIVGQGAEAVYLLDQNVVKRNVISGAVTMANPNPLTLTTIPGQKLIPTGFALDGSLAVLGYDDGPYMLDANEEQFFPEMPELDRNTEHCRVLTTWFPLGTVVGLRSGARYQRGGSGSSFGPEIIDGNRSNIVGFPTGFSGWERWGYMPYYSEVDSKTYLLAFDPKRNDGRTPLGMSPYAIANLGTRRSDAVLYIGTVNGLRSRGTVVGGYGQDLYYFTIGSTREELDDSSYAFAASGTLYMTELRRNRGTTVDLEWIQVEASGCAAARTLTLAVRVIDTTGSSSVITLNGSVTGVNDAITANGRSRRYFVDNSSVPLTTVSGVRVRPQVAYATNTSATSPVLEGKLLVGYRERPAQVRVYDLVLVLTTDNVSTEDDKESDLFSAQESGALLVAEDIDGATSYYVRVENLDVTEVIENGGGRDNLSAKTRVAKVRLVAVPVAAGD